MSRYIRAMGADEVTIVEESPVAPAPLIRSAMNVANGRTRGGSEPYFRFGAQARSYPFSWHGGPGGVPSSSPAAESRGLGGSGDLYESGLNPYTMAYPPLAHRGFIKPRTSALSGVLDDLSTNERRLLGLVAVGVAGGFLLRHFSKRKGRRANPSPRVRRGRRRRRRSRRR